MRQKTLTPGGVGGGGYFDSFEAAPPRRKKQSMQMKLSKKQKLKP